MNFQDIDNLMNSALQERMFTAAALLVSRRKTVVFEQYYGTLGGIGTAPVTQESLFDLASLTKILATTPCWMILAGRNPEILDRKISGWFPDLPQDKAGITPKHLLAHSSGLPAWLPYYLHGDHTPDKILGRIFSEPLQYEIGHGCIYSDLGFMLLASILKKETGQELSLFAAENIYQPLGIASDLMFLPSGEEHRTVITREGDPAGIVHDLNARSLGGISGHAGLFGTVGAVKTLAEHYLYSLGTSEGIFAGETIRNFCNRAAYLPDCTRSLGFDTPSAEGSTSGEKFSSDSVGHTGFTGVSLWIDIPREIVVVLLTNRVYMGESDLRIKAFRPLIHDKIMEQLE